MNRLLDRHYMTRASSSDTRIQIQVSNLPLEIIDLIFTSLADEHDNIASYHALTQCLFVSKAFCTLSRRYLFAQVTISDSGPTFEGKRNREEARKMDGFLQLLQNDPLRSIDPLALQVHTLELSLLSIFSPEYVLTNVSNYTPLTWNTHRESLPAIMDMLPKLHTFRLHFDFCMEWEDIGKPIYDSLKKLFWESPLLTSISLRNISNFQPEFPAMLEPSPSPYRKGRLYQPSLDLRK
ncbi:hypothetical protein CPB84DRAFT_416261 [Gymnopilus junonius]|uniref:F-box domain-containing protein n=1 Tax=Gymnopilus junonius TaxID=109634 RepID=A0A9P5N9D6_GYMJU|nr:hypothetical protein CPB84DRAFT_416261 [Gymnopilus junonius]